MPSITKLQNCEFVKIKSKKCFNYSRGLVSSGISLVLLAEGEGDLDGLEGCDGGHGVVVAVSLDDNVRLC